MTDARSTDATAAVLLADANEDSRLMYADYLRALRYDIDEAADGRSALAKAIASRPRVLVTDTRLPGISGLDLCRLLRRDMSTKDTAIIVVTADALPRSLEIAAAAGADTVLVKPCLPEQLADEIGRVLSVSAQLRQRARALRALADVELARSSELVERSAATIQRMWQKNSVYRRDTSEPPAAPPALLCPNCDQSLRYVNSHIGGVNVRQQEQWDRFECPTCGDRFEYRHRTRTLRVSLADTR